MLDQVDLARVTVISSVESSAIGNFGKSRNTVSVWSCVPDTRSRLCQGGRGKQPSLGEMTCFRHREVPLEMKKG